MVYDRDDRSWFNRHFFHEVDGQRPDGRPVFDWL